MKKTTKRTIVILIGILCLAVAVWAAPKLYRAYQAERIEKANIEYPFLDDNVVIKRYQGKDYYVAKKPYEGEYDFQEIYYEWDHITLPDGTEEYYAQKMIYMEVPFIQEDGSVIYDQTLVADLDGKKYSRQELDESNTLRVMDYEEYTAFCEQWEITPKYTDPNLNYIVRSFFSERYHVPTKLFGVRYEDSTAVLYFHDNHTVILPEHGPQIYTIPTNQDVDSVEIVRVYTEDEYKNILGIGPTWPPEPQ